MKLHQASAQVALAALAALAGSSALAQVPGWYAGGSIGRSAATIDDERITGGLAGQGLGTSSIEDKDRATGYKLYGGWQFNPYIGLEAGYFDLGRFGYVAHTTPSGSLTGAARVNGFNLDLVGTLPLTGALSATGRIGATSVRSRDHFSAVAPAAVPYANASPHERSANWKAGLGLAYAINDALSVRADLERYRLRDAVGNTGHIDMLSVGLVYRFGAKPQPVRAAEAPAPAPVYVAAAPPPPAPIVMAAAPPPPAPMRVTLSADSLFDFDKAVVKPAGRASLDKLAADLRGVRYDSIHVTGHADRFGSDGYNMRLSTERAQAVAAYLVQDGVTAGTISSSGAGETRPVTQAGDCKGSKPTAAVVACLQPDRRVEVEVTGTR